MLKLFVRFLTAMIFISGIYLVYVNSSFTSLQQIQSKETIFVNFQNFPEIILPLKEETRGYQYELVRFYLNSLNKKNIIQKKNNSDIKIFYSTDTCNTCVIVKEEDLLLISSINVIHNNDIEVTMMLENININNITDNYQINYVEYDDR